jgi:outer membrane murein-binding lipoprotein Lpp
MKRAAIIGLLALLALTTVVFAAPALSTSSSEKVTIKSLARQVRALRSQVASLRGQVAAARSAASAAQGTANAAQGTANTAQATASRLDGCLNSAVPVTRYAGFVWTDAGALFTDYDPDVLGYVPDVDSGNFGFDPALDVTRPGSPVGYYLAIVEPSCAGGFHMAQREQAVPR